MVSLAFVLFFCFFSKPAAAQDSLAEDVKSIIDNAVNDSNAGKVKVSNNDYNVADTTATDSQNQNSQDQNNQGQNKPADASQPSITLASPQQREVMVNTNVKFSGKSSPGVIVDVTVTDEDTNNKSIQHQSLSKLNGSATTGKDGGWLYVPQYQFVPGEYSVTASFNDPKLGSIQSEKIFFTIVDPNGASNWPIISRTWIISMSAVGAAIFFAIIFLIWRRRVSSQKSANNSANSLRANLADENRAIPKSNDSIESNEELEELNDEALEVEKELIGVAREVNDSMKKMEKFKRESIESKDNQSNGGMPEQEMEKYINGVEEELLNVSEEVTETMERVGDMRGRIVGKIRRKKRADQGK